MRTEIKGITGLKLKRKVTRPLIIRKTSIVRELKGLNKSFKRFIHDNIVRDEIYENKNGKVIHEELLVTDDSDSELEYDCP